jgi:hypothetical protein
MMATSTAVSVQIPGVCPIHHQSVLLCSCRFSKLAERVRLLEHRRQLGQDVSVEMYNLRVAAAMTGIKLHRKVATA